MVNCTKCKLCKYYKDMTYLNKGKQLIICDKHKKDIHTIVDLKINTNECFLLK